MNAIRVLWRSTCSRQKSGRLHPERFYIDPQFTSLINKELNTPDHTIRDYLHSLAIFAKNSPVPYDLSVEGDVQSIVYGYPVKTCLEDYQIREGRIVAKIALKGIYCINI